MELNENFSDTEKDRPSPSDFAAYLPWACSQMQLNVAVIVTKVFQQEYVSFSTMNDKKVKKKSKPQSDMELASDQNQDNKSLFISMSRDCCVKILAVYDSNENLVQLKFLNNSKIPRTVLRIIGMIIQYQHHLSNITINRGMDEYTLYEIYKFLPKSHITDLCLDNAYVKEGNYYTILETPNSIKHLSLSRCSINDDVIKTIADTLCHPLPSSKALSILNLSSNRITDVGAKYLAESLRSNRQLQYLNLADNMLTDDGAGYIFNVLVKFPLTYDELVASRARHISYLKDRKDLIVRIAKELRVGDFEKRSPKRKVKQVSVPPKKKGLDKEPSLKSMPESKSLVDFDKTLMEKAAAIAAETLGEFKDPFNKTNTFVEDGILRCYGNNVLCYLNLSYNNLSYLSVKRLLDVLTYQQNSADGPRGLVNVSIEGNLIPIQCKELIVIDQILGANLAVLSRRLSGIKKKVPGKAGLK